jgi:RNA polymerase sigma factor (sigma-70 family)
MKEKNLNKTLHLSIPTAEIIRKITDEGRTEMYSILYNRFHDKVCQKCMTYIKDKPLAKEFTNDILVKAFENLKNFKNKSSFSSWLYVITTNYCIDYLRIKKKLHYPSWNIQNDIPDIIDESEEQLFEFNYDDLMSVLEKVHPEEKALILMKYKDGLSLKEIGISLRITEDAAKMRLKRARSRLIYLYKQEYFSV